MSSDLSAMAGATKQVHRRGDVLDSFLTWDGPAAVWVCVGGSVRHVHGQS